MIDNGLQRLFHCRWKKFAITLVRDDRGKLRETFAPCRRNEAELGKVGSERIARARHVSATPASSDEASATAKTRRSKGSKLDADAGSNLKAD